jgi:hypothetical protein
MRVEFTFTIPDDPYTQNYNEEQVVNAIYEGPRWHLMRWEIATGRVHNVIASAETKDNLDIGGRIEEEGFKYLPLDASKNPWEASYLTHLYTHDKVENPVYVHGLADDGFDMGSWEYHYSEDNVLTQCRDAHALQYNPDSDTFTHPPFRTHMANEEDFWAGNLIQAANIRRSVAEEGMYIAADKAKLLAYAEWLEKLDSRYRTKNIPYWQIPFPTDIPRLNS